MTLETTPETVKQISYLAAALKAPRITEAATRLADHARDAGRIYEDYLAAVLEREVPPAMSPEQRSASAPPASPPGNDERLRLGLPVRDPTPDWLARLRRVYQRGQHRRPVRPSLNGENTSCHLTRKRRGPAWVSRALCHRDALDHPTHRGPRLVCPATVTSMATPLRANHR